MTLNSAAHQLDAARTLRSWPAPHVQALVSVASEPLVHLLVEFGLPTYFTGAWNLGNSQGWRHPTHAANRPETLFLQRSLIGAALMAADQRTIRIGEHEAIVADVSGTDVAVGLLEPAHRTIVTQLKRASVVDGGLPLDDRELTYRVCAERIPGVDTVDDIPVDRYSITLGMTTVEIQGPNGSTAVVDAAGRVVLLGREWRRGMDRS
ncbi:hypothetical protein [Catellatospora sichuanensis]|uniref:hypothetical protein n=1 Tax=Catellatospora sichuanensis TaxID=1969805 RepID=UPI0011824A58|nr:hypothetical protein [Catellatospora sichuanensis]